MSGPDAVWTLLEAGWQGRTPRLTAADAEGVLHRLPLTGAFSWDLSPERTCIGQTVTGRHRPCGGRPRPPFSRCDAHLRMPSPECVLEPKGRMDQAHHCQLCDRSHVVYVAMHGTLPKVGLTSASRVEARLFEQGADAWFRVATTADRGEARRLEREINIVYGIPEWRRHHETLPQLTRPLDRPRIKTKAEAVQQRLQAHQDVDDEIHWVPSAPVPRPLPSTPHMGRPGGRHVGTWLGAKGNYLFYTPKPGADRLAVGKDPVVALKRGELPGRRFNPGDA